MSISELGAPHVGAHPKYFGALYAAIAILGLHFSIVIYINSSFLGMYVGDNAIGVLYTVGSAVTVLSFLFISRVLHNVGNYKLTLLLTFLEMGALIGMAFADSLRVAVPLFILHQAVIPLIFFNLDVYMEKLIGHSEKQTGGKRGLFLTVVSLAGAVAPLITGYLVTENGSASFTLAYIVSALLLLPFLFIIVRYFRAFSDANYKEIKVLSTIRSFWIKDDIRNVFIAHLLLQLFFTWMVVYVPLYLATQMGFSWTTIGSILFVALMAYVLLEYPIGLIADRYTGEKEMMLFGFTIIILSTSALSFITTPTIWLWISVLFLTRVGASFVEVTTESYFFKHTRGTDANIISFFRITRPLSYVFGALLGSLTLLYLPFQFMFLVLGAFMIPALFFVLQLKDTK